MIEIANDSTHGSIFGSYTFIAYISLNAELKIHGKT